MEAKFNPQSVETRLFQFWKDKNLFVPSENEINAPTYSVIMPPPNITNSLHLGHALNNTLQDVMIRYHRMLGYACVWKIGVDHAGIATQNMVERQLLKEGLTKESLGKEKFIERIWDWKNQYGATILTQLQRLGVSGDWEHDRFTMDEVSSRAVKEIFVKLYSDGLVYRGEYIINWCPHCLTTISDDEVEHEEVSGHLYYIRYVLEDNSNTLIVSTTRPETILGDVALAVNPKDTRYSQFIGKKVKVPCVDRYIPILADDSVEVEFGTGVLKVTPSHDPTDFLIGQKHQLPFIEVIDKYGKMNSLAGSSEGVDRFEYRKLFVQSLKQANLLEKVEDYKHSRGICYRCNTVIEPRVSIQWFVKINQLAKPALQALKNNEIKFFPSKWEKVYEHWMNNIRDWSISRQLWWGHSIPAYYCTKCNHIEVSIDIPGVCSNCGNTQFTGDPDVLDTWFSSWLWPFTVFDVCKFTQQVWKTEEFERYFPTQYLATAPEILFFWVARMVMLSLYVDKQVPFKKVFFNSTVCDMQGRKMSKSLGNGIDPLDIIDIHGADALRFTLLFIAPKGERIRLDNKSFDVGSRLITKLWNAARFIFTNKPVVYQQRNTEITLSDVWDNWIILKYITVLELAKVSIEKFDYYTYTHTIYQFFWDDFCDWFLESKKQKLYQGDTQTYSILETLLDGIIRIFHPVMPFITEEIWQILGMNQMYSGISISKQRFSIVDKLPSISNDSVEKCSLLQEIISSLRSIKKEFNIGDKQEVIVYQEDETLLVYKDDLKHFVNAIVQKNKDDSFSYLLLVCGEYNIYVQLPENINIDNEKRRILEQIQILDKEILRAKNKLANESFIKNAEPDLIKIEQQKILDLSRKREQYSRFIESLEGS